MTNTHLNEPLWKKLGSIKLSGENITSSKIHSWLARILAPLNISSDFRTRILNATKRAASRMPQPNANQTSTVHLTIYIPRGKLPSDCTWGFFQINRSETKEVEKNSFEQIINFYLFMERNSG